jgi:hypothetical protein
VDFDHFSLDTDKSSEAAGWITELESRDTGLWARVRWSDAGLAAVQGGRFRLMSPVFPPPSACEDLGGGKIRPHVLVSVALTNEPNIKGGCPLANRHPGENRTDAKRKLMWVLGNPPSGEHCGVCVSRAGQIKTAVEWARMKQPPCNCHCTLEPVDDDTANRWSDMARAASLAVRRAKSAQLKAQEKRIRDQSGVTDGSVKAAAREIVLRDLARARSARR